MKKFYKRGLVITGLALACLLTACGEDGTEPESSGIGDQQTSSSVTEEHVHNFGDWTVVTAADCTQDGQRERRCLCGEKETETITALGHQEQSVAGKEPTCTETGLTEGKSCTACQAVLTEQTVIEALGHEETVDPGKAASCTETGLTEGKHCARCSEVLVAQEEIKALGHQFLNYVSNGDALCLQDGTETAKCERCDEKDTRTAENSALGHQEIVNEGVDASCIEIGLTGGSHCERCNAMVTAPTLIPAKGHTYEEGYCVDCGAKEIKTSVGLTYELNEDERSYRVTGIGTCTDKKVVIPQVYNGLPVTAVAEKAFAGNEKLTEIVIQSGVTDIGASAFDGCISLNAITIPHGVQTIGQFAFRSCGKLQKIEIPDSVQSIGSGAFFFCNGLKGVYVTDLAAWCGIDFGNMGANPLSTGRNLYIDGKKVTALVIPGGVTEIKPYAFTQGSIQSVTIAEGVTVIGDYAFYYCDALTKIDLGTTVEQIGSYAFDGCRKLASLAVPASLRSIGEGAFVECRALTAITVDEKNEFYYSVDNCLIEKQTKTLVLGCRNSVIPMDGSVEAIGANAFYGAVGLKEITIPKSVNSVGKYAFNNCRNLEKIIFEGTQQRWDAIDKDEKWVWDVPNYTMMYMNVEMPKLELKSDDITLSPGNGMSADLYELLKDKENFDPSKLTITSADEGVVRIEGAKAIAVSNSKNGVLVTIAYDDQSITCLVRVEGAGELKLNKTDVTLNLAKDGYEKFELKVLDAEGNVVKNIQWHFSNDFSKCCTYTIDEETGVMTITATAVTTNLTNGTYVKVWFVCNGERYECIIRVVNKA